VCGPLPALFNNCSDPTSAACFYNSGKYYTLGSYTNSFLVPMNGSSSSVGGFLLSYSGGVNNKNATLPSRRDGTCNSLYDRETAILFTCGEGLV
jgi:hypothetical protein